MATDFGVFLKEKRTAAGFGLKAFAEMVGMQTSNLSAVEHGRRKPPSDAAKLHEIAEALGLSEGTHDWARFFDLAQRASGIEDLPADVRHMGRRKLVPALLRTIDNQQLRDAAIQQLIEEIASGRILPEGKK
jgi:transcriptional regulator with XRE-family HTH domain